MDEGSPIDKKTYTEGILWKPTVRFAEPNAEGSTKDKGQEGVEPKVSRTQIRKRRKEQNQESIGTRTRSGRAIRPVSK